MGDDISTDEIMPAGARALLYRANIPELSVFAFEGVDPSYAERAVGVWQTGHAILAGANYSQGSSREYAVLAPRYLGLYIVLAKSFAHMHGQALVSFGVVPLVFKDPRLYDQLKQGEILRFSDLRQQLTEGTQVCVENVTRGFRFSARHLLPGRQLEVLLAGGMVRWLRSRQDGSLQGYAGLS